MSAADRMTPQFLARQMLIDAYTRLFETGEQTDWQAWGDRAHAVDYEKQKHQPNPS